MRQDGPGDGQQAEHVDVEERACFRVGGFFDRAHQAATGVVDQDVDAAEPFDRGVHRGSDLFGIADVESDGKQLIPAPRDRIEHRLGLAGCRDHAVAAG